MIAIPRIENEHEFAGEAVLFRHKKPIEKKEI